MFPGRSQPVSQNTAICRRPNQKAARHLGLHHVTLCNPLSYLFMINPLKTDVKMSRVLRRCCSVDDQASYNIKYIQKGAYYLYTILSYFHSFGLYAIHSVS